METNLSAGPFRKCGQLQSNMLTSPRSVVRVVLFMKNIKRKNDKYFKELAIEGVPYTLPAL